MENLPNLIKKNYGPVMKFVDNVLKMDYGTFNYKVKTKSFHYPEIKIIIDSLGIAFEDLDDQWERVFKTAEKLFAKNQISIDEMKMIKDCESAGLALNLLSQMQSGGRGVSTDYMVMDEVARMDFGVKKEPVNLVTKIRAKVKQVIAAQPERLQKTSPVKAVKKAFEPEPDILTGVANESGSMSDNLKEFLDDELPGDQDED